MLMRGGVAPCGGGAWQCSMIWSLKLFILSAICEKLTLEIDFLVVNEINLDAIRSCSVKV